ncbi:hypothetical protein V6U89_29470 [Micromonospora sp. CPCC 206171]|uniref:hypothetical protein n=1 Tax=Micromonospora sp. CPCC 206171 TaxID=3122405 RepID=UPI002FF14AF2
MDPVQQDRVIAHRQKRMRDTVNADSLVTGRHDAARPFLRVSLNPLAGSRAVEGSDVRRHLHDAVHVQLYLAVHVDPYADTTAKIRRHQPSAPAHASPGGILREKEDPALGVEHAARAATKHSCLAMAWPHGGRRQEQRSTSGHR